MIEKQLTIVNKLGLHARAAAKLAGVSAQFSSNISIAFNDTRVDGKSIMSLMLLAASCGSVIAIACDGEDEDEAMSALETLIENRFGEAE